MTALKTKNGVNLFSGEVLVKGFEIHKEGKNFIAVLEGTKIGIVKGDVTPEGSKKAVGLDTLMGDIDPKTLIGKDPTTLSVEEIAALQNYLAELAGAKVDKPEKESKAKAEKKEKTEAKEKKPLPKGIKSVADLEKLSVKDLWKKVGQPIADELEGVNSRSKKDELIQAIAAYYGLEIETEDEEEDDDVALNEDQLPEEMEDDSNENSDEEEDDEEDDEDEEDEEDEEDDEDDEDEEDEEDENDEDEDDEDDEDEDDEDEDDEDDDEDEDEDESDKVTKKDVEKLFKSGDKKAIIAFCKKHNISLPKTKLSASKVKQIIMEALFGDEE